MGIRGLATFIAHYSDKYLENHKLKDCYLVIDGNSLACQLYASSSKFNNAFGGDYDRFATSVIEFFDALQKCKVAPLVIFDGGYEICKLKTTFSRIKQKWALAKEVTPISPGRCSIFPCFLKEVVKDVLRELHVPFAQCLFEADAEIAATARHLNCPVLSYDSDFFVYDVLYIPFPTLYLLPCKEKSSQSKDETHYLSCSLYRVENFLKHYGGLQKEILPFLSIMLGCDYIGNRVYKQFVSNLKKKTCRGSNQRQKRIASLLQWLRTETLESAKSKVLGCLRKHKREDQRSQIKRIISMYVQDSSELLPFLGIEIPTLEIQFPNNEKHMLHGFEEQELKNEWQGGDSDSNTSDERNIIYTSDDNSSESEESEFSTGEENGEQSEATDKQKEIICTWEVKKASSLPEWFLNKFRQGHLSSVLMDMVIHNLYFPPPQVEDYDYPSSHIISVPLIAVIYGLLVGYENVKPLKCEIRKHRSPNHYILIPPILETESMKLPSLDDIPKLSVVQSLTILIETAGLNSIDRKRVASFPDSWQLYIITLVFWARQSAQSLVNSSHISALLLCLILLDVVGKNVVCIGSTKKRRRKQKNKAVLSGAAMNEIETEVERDNEHETQGQGSDCVEEMTRPVVEAFEHVSSEECGFVKKVLRSMCLMEEKMKTRPKLFNVSIVHTFAQFQSCLLHFTYLNTLLGNPLPSCVSFRAFSGTFVYNMYNNLKQRTNVLDYLSHLLSMAPSILALFKFLRQEVEYLVPDIPSTNHVKKKPRKKKLRSKFEKTEFVSNQCEEKSDDTEFEDPCNSFGALTLI